jgi:hypothetical protein
MDLKIEAERFRLNWNSALKEKPLIPPHATSVEWQNDKFFAPRMSPLRRIAAGRRSATERAYLAADEAFLREEHARSTDDRCGWTL